MCHTVNSYLNTLLIKKCYDEQQTSFIHLCCFYHPVLANVYQKELTISHPWSSYRAFQCLHSFCHASTAKYFVPVFAVVSQSDCYVSLWLPTASDEKFHTKTIKNCRNPMWNETFYFRIQRQVKVHKPNLSSLSHLYAASFSLAWNRMLCLLVSLPLYLMFP